MGDTSGQDVNSWEPCLGSVWDSFERAAQQMTTQSGLFLCRDWAERRIHVWSSGVNSREHWEAGVLELDCDLSSAFYRMPTALAMAREGTLVNFLTSFKFPQGMAFWNQMPCYFW